MAEDQRRSKREVKIKRDSAFEYDEKVLNALTRNNNSEGDSWYPCVDSASDRVNPNTDTALVNVDSVINTSVFNSWSQVVFNTNPNVNSAENSPVFSDNFVNTSHTKSRLLQSASITATVSKEVNSRCESGRRTSSTAAAFLDLPGNYFSATSLNSMGVSDSEPEVNSKHYSVSKTGGAAGFSGNSAFTPESPSPDDGLTAAILSMCQDMRALTAKVDTFNDRLSYLEAKSGIESGEESSNRLSSHNAKQSVKQKVPVGKKSTTKLERVEFEKGRTEKVVLDKLKDRKKEQAKSDTEVSSEEEQDTQGVKKKLSRKKRDQARRRAAAIMKKAGATFPEEEDVASNNTGTSDSEGFFNPGHSKKSKRSVKSGAKVRCRPVVKTELWPHPISNEDDGDNSTSDNISLAKFLSCFTYIMISCEESEVSGRALLLHAVCLVLEYLPWADARAFHNLVMTKVEQDRISWDDDFTDLANEFIDNKVRQSLREKSRSSGTRGNYRHLGKGYGYQQRSSYGTGNNNNPNSTYNVVCKNWNQGSCSYGDRCRRRHVCWTCHEVGKTEHHKSSTHGASAGARQTS